MDEAKKILRVTDKQKCTYAIPLWLRDQQIEIAIKKVNGRIQPHYAKREEAVAVAGFGPSLNDTWQSIKNFQCVITCSGAHKFLIERDIIPNWHVEVDPRSHKIELLGPPHKNVEYLVASTCHPDYFDHLAGFNVKLWHVFDATEDGRRLLPPGEWAITGGCLHATAMVHTEDGKKPIKWIVDHKYFGKVLSIDQSGRFVWQRIIGHSGILNRVQKRWVSLGGANKRGLILTEDHRCAVIDDPFNPSIYFLPAKETSGKYSIRLPEEHNPPTGNDYPLYNHEQLAILFGTLMGDSSIGKDGRINCDHGAKQLKYLELKRNILGGRITSRLHTADEWGGERSTYRWRQAANAQTRLLRDAVYKGDKKGVDFLLPRLETSSLAFWYMDDGCLHKCADSRPLVELCTHGFSPEDHKKMMAYFQNRWGMNPKAVTWTNRAKSYHKLLFRVDDSEKFLKLVAPYIPPVMHYKLPDHIQPSSGFPFNTTPLAYAARLVTTVKYLNTSWCKSKLYDIEVENTHNFVANRIVVHNCDVGLRAMTIAAFLGFRDLHIFGLDGCAKGEERHAAFHPNGKQKYAEVEFNGATYLTTPAMLEAAKQTLHELKQMPAVKAKFYGEGLTQAMMKDYVPAKEEPKNGLANCIGFSKPELISAEYVELNRKLHQENMAYGVGGERHAPTVLKLSESLKTKNILDYGCGKGRLAHALPFQIAEYDPAIPGKDQSPKPADIVVATDVLEHVEPSKIDFVLADLQRCVRKVGYFVIHTQAASKTYANGENTHLLQREPDWWENKLKAFFKVPDKAIIYKQPLMHVVVAPK